MINDWCVCFYRKSDTWYGRMVPGEFKHVALFRYVPETHTWIYLDYSFRGVSCLTAPAQEDGCFPLAKVLSDGKCAVVRVNVITRHFSIRGVSTCVSFVKHAIGMRRWWIITPDQLYWRLLDEGAEHLVS